MEAACIIPAKGRSTRLPGKNLLPLGGVPMVVRSVRSALDAGRFSFVGVSSDDADILALAEQAGATPLPRAPELCGDTVRAKDVVHAHLAELGRPFDIVALLMNTNPLRTADHVREAFDLLVSSGARNLVSVREFEFCPGMAMRIEDGRLKPYAGGELDWVREDAYPTGYHMNGAIFMSRYEDFMRTRTFLDADTVPYVMDARSSMDVDTPDDLCVAQAFLRNET